MAVSERQAHDDQITLDGNQFRDLPTSTEHSAFISYFDTALWVADHLTTGEGSPPDTRGRDVLDQAEGRIRFLCGGATLVAWGFRALSDGRFDSELSEIPQTAWLNLWIDITSGQPHDDKEKYGGREYGEARRTNPTDSAPKDIAWTAICFRKSDVLRCWPKTRGIASLFSRQNAVVDLASYLKQHPDSSRDQAKTHLRTSGHSVSKNAFNTEIWPSARKKAGLPPKARAGRKPTEPKSSGPASD